MKPQGLKTHIFLDSGDPKETQQALALLGFLDGQTTNPTYFAKSSMVQEHLKTAGKFTREELLASYRQTIETIAGLMPQGSISIEVYADESTTAEEMLKQARQMFSWTKHAYIKFPIISAGMQAARQALEEGMRVNMTLCFSQEQAAAVYSLTQGAKKGDVYISPFMGRHFDNGRNGVDLVRNIIKMYEQGDGHVEVLAASLRNIEQFYAAIQAGADIVTLGFKYLLEWHQQELKLPKDDFVYEPHGFSPIPYQDLDLSKPWDQFNLEHELTKQGLEQFARDWNQLITE